MGTVLLVRVLLARTSTVYAFMHIISKTEQNEHCSSHLYTVVVFPYSTAAGKKKTHTPENNGKAQRREVLSLSHHANSLDLLW